MAKAEESQITSQSSITGIEKMCIKNKELIW